MHSSYTSPCKLNIDPVGNALAPIVSYNPEEVFPPPVAGAADTSQSSWVWVVPKLDKYKTDGKEYVDLLQNNIVHTNNLTQEPISLTASGDLYIYCNIISEQGHIGEHLSSFRS